MKKPRIGEASLGAVVGAVVGAIGGLIAVVLPLAILTRNVQVLSEARMLGMMGFFVSTPLGWLIGGQFGPRLEGKLSEQAAGLVGGAVGGLMPVAGFMLWGWYLITR